MDRASWSDPPEFLMIEIVKRIDSCFDISECGLFAHFGGLPSPTRVKLLLFLLTSHGQCFGKSLIIQTKLAETDIKETIICRLEKIVDSLNVPGSSIGWLVMIEDGKSSIISSPKQSLTPVVLNLMDFRVVEICKAYKLLDVVPFTFFTEKDSPGITKTVVSSFGSNCTSPDDFTIFVLQYPGNLGFLKPGDEKWTLPNYVQTRYEDIVSYKGKLYVVCYTGELLMFDSSWRSTEIASHVPYDYHFKSNMYLVESFGDLLLVEKSLVLESYEYDFGSTYNFLVYKLDEQEQCWVKVRSLEDITLFVGRQCSFSVRAKDFNGNCIYFRDMDLNADVQSYVYYIKGGCTKLLKYSPCPTDISWPPPNWC